MSITENILRLNNVRGVVTSLIDRGNGAQLVNQEYGKKPGETLFDTTLSQELAEKGVKQIEAIPLDVAIRYTPEVSCTFTQNPVQIGVNVNDHSYNNPDTLTVSFGTSDVKGTLARLTGIVASAAAGFDDIKKNKTPSKILLDLLYRAKEERTLFQVDDGLHTYTDMMIQNITYDKDKTTYRSLVATVTLQQFIFVSTDYNAKNGITRTPVLPVDKSTFAYAKGFLDRIRLV